jgi:hypothetical protein
MVGVSLGAALATAGVSGFAGAFFGGDFFGELWPEVFTTMTAIPKARINKRVQSADIIPCLLGSMPYIYVFRCNRSK